MSERWKDVGDDFASLKEAFKERYDEADDGPDSDEVKGALSTIGEGLERLFSSISDVARDDEFKAQAKATMKTLGDALSDAISEVGVKGHKAEKTTPDSEESEADDAAEADASSEPMSADETVETLREDVSDEL